MTNTTMISDQINAVINNLCDKLHVPVNEILSTLMFQAKLCSICQIFIAILTTACFLISLRYFLIEAKKNTNAGPYDNPQASWVISLCIFIFFFSTFILVFVATLCSIDIVLAGFFNQKYWALQKILSMIQTRG